MKRLLLLLIPVTLLAGLISPVAASPEAAAGRQVVHALYDLVMEVSRYNFRHGLFSMSLQNVGHLEATLTGLRAAKVTGVEQGYQETLPERLELDLMAIESLVFSGRYAQAESEAAKLLPQLSSADHKRRLHVAMALAAQRSYRADQVELHLRAAGDGQDAFLGFILDTLRREHQGTASYAEAQQAYRGAFARLHPEDRGNWPPPASAYLQEALLSWLQILKDGALTPEENRDAEALIRAELARLQGASGSDLEVQLAREMAHLALISRWRSEGRWGDCDAGLKALDKEFQLLPALARKATEEASQRCAPLAAEVVRLSKSHPDLDGRGLDIVASAIHPVEADLGQLQYVDALRFQEMARYRMYRPDSTVTDKDTAVKMLEVGLVAGVSRDLQKREFTLDENPVYDQMDFAIILQPPGWQEQVRARARELLAAHSRAQYSPGMVVDSTYLAEILSQQGHPAEARQTAESAQKLADQHLQEFGYGGTDSLRFRRARQRLCELLVRLDLADNRPDAALARVARLQDTEASGWRQRALARRPAAQPLIRLRGQQEALSAEASVSYAAGSPVSSLVAKNKSEFFQALAGLRQRHPDFEKLLAVRPTNFAQRQKFIPADTAVLQYFPGRDALYIFWVTSDSLKIQRVAITAEELKKRVTALRRAITTLNQAKFDQASTALYETLVQPFAQEVAACKRIAFVPTANLLYVPFVALRSPKGYLLESHDCVTLTKSADFDTLGHPSSPPQGSLLALGDPDGTLPGAAQEARKVATASPGARCYVGRDATADKLSGDLPFKTIHLATHGVLDAGDPMKSYLVMSNGQLRLSDIYGLNLSKTRLVTLSACQTAVAERDPGSEIASLADAFSVAGAPTVIATLWSVDDIATQALMTRFYQSLNQGKGAAESLREAQLSLLATDGRAMPFYWAAFSLYGDWR